MSGIYIHIPFCKKACHYCNFHFSTTTSLLNDFIEALLVEIEVQKNYLTSQVTTVYFGGGTPSILSGEMLRNILNVLYKTFKIANDAEITLEANPDDINSEKIKEWRLCGVNRLSVGVQSFFDEDLLWMNRAHNAQSALSCIELAQKEGFQNLSIDLIYGTPTLTDEHWKQNVEKAISLNIPHLSCYALTVEAKTALEKMIKQKKVQNIEAEKQARHFEILMLWLKQAGYEHYEISNFARPGHRSRHNSSYWQGKHYLGLGPSAHSFNGISRQWNVANNAIYIKNLQLNELAYEMEILTNSQQINEYIMTSLRTIEGIDLKKIRDNFGAKVECDILKEANKYFPKLLTNNAGFLIATTEGKLMTDGIAADLFVENQ